MCQHVIVDASFLDICAGSGAMGLEALSRGGAFSGFIEHNRQAIFSLKKNIDALNVKEACELYFGDALHVLKSLNSRGIAFDIAYFDPPYTKTKNEANVFVKKVLHAVDASEHIVKQDGLFFLEESLFANVEQLKLKTLLLEKTKRFGNSQLFCFRKKWRC